MTNSTRLLQNKVNAEIEMNYICAKRTARKRRGLNKDFEASTGNELFKSAKTG
jgi:hypothetical protein